jgi:hypothetical protein
MNGRSDRRSFNPWSSPLPDPSADARLLVPGFETLQRANREWARRIRRLRQGTTAAREIAEDLARCQNGQRCNSSICPICQGRTRILLIEQAIKLFSADTSPIMVTVVSDQAAVPVGQLNRTEPRRELDRLRQQLSSTLAICHRAVGRRRQAVMAWGLRRITILALLKHC